ncbi:MAG: SH3 domain-containing protein, partial [Chloroflexota bacterium]
MSDFLETITMRLSPLRTLIFAALLAMALGLLADGVARADRWGPPWQGHVAVGGTVVRAQPDSTAPVVGPLGRGAIVVVLEEKRGADGEAWLRIPDGYLPAEDVEESFTPWTAELS